MPSHVDDLKATLGLAIPPRPVPLYAYALEYETRARQVVTVLATSVHAAEQQADQQLAQSGDAGWSVGDEVPECMDYTRSSQPVNQAKIDAWVARYGPVSAPAAPAPPGPTLWSPDLLF